MAAISIRLEAMRGLVAALVAILPGGVPVTVSPAPPAARAAFPSVAIVPTRWSTFMDQAQEHYSTDTTLVMNVGRHESLVQIRVCAATPQARADIEQLIMDLFAGTTPAASMRPGILLTTISSIPALSDFVAAWELENEEWQDEMAFGNQYWSIIEVTGIIPALVAQGTVYTIEDLRLALTEDMTTVLTPPDVETSTPTIEVREINQDGSITPV